MIASGLGNLFAIFREPMPLYIPVMRRHFRQDFCLLVGNQAHRFPITHKLKILSTGILRSKLLEQARLRLMWVIRIWSKQADL